MEVDALDSLTPSEELSLHLESRISTLFHDFPYDDSLPKL
jgi:hypothetical protein